MSGVCMNLSQSESPLILWTEGACHDIWPFYRPSRWSKHNTLCTELDMMVLPSFFSFIFGPWANFHEQFFMFVSLSISPSGLKTLQCKNTIFCRNGFPPSKPCHVKRWKVEVKLATNLSLPTSLGLDVPERKWMDQWLGSVGYKPNSSPISRVRYNHLP